MLERKIFVVDDDPFIHKIFEKILNNLGFNQIYFFKNGNECINHIHLNPELIFLDYNLGDLNGIEVLKKVKQYYPGIPVVFTTCTEDLELALFSIKYGSVDFLLKRNICKNEVSQIINKISNYDNFSLGL